MSKVSKVVGAKGKIESIESARCYDHNFRRFSTIFGEKMAFLSNANVMIKFMHT
jgi:hypothetical protein